jgi:hypothetical protein
MKHLLQLFAFFLLLSFSAVALGDGRNNGHKGLNREAKQDLVQSGMTQYLGHFAPAASSDVGDGWTKTHVRAELCW